MILSMTIEQQYKEIRPYSADSRLPKGTRRVVLHLPYDKGSLLDMLYREAKVEQVEYGETIDVTVVCGPRTLGQVQPFMED